MASELSVSRAEVQRWVDEGRVLVAGKVVPAAHRLRAGDPIEVTPAPPPRSDAVPEQGIAFDVLYVDDDLIVLDKPAGLVVHPSKGHEAGTLVNGLLGRGLFAAHGAPALADPLDDEGHLRPGIVHRLDAGTSGVMVVARTPAAREHLKKQFADHSIERVYEALVVGAAKTATHSTLHGRHPTDRMRFTSKVKEGRHAITHVAVVERFGERATHVRCKLETGRTHQIRMHLSEAGTPVLGDPLYGKSPKDERVRTIGQKLGHQALCARVLGFVHPRTKESLRFVVDLPSDFEVAREALAHLVASKPG